MLGLIIFFVFLYVLGLIIFFRDRERGGEITLKVVKSYQVHNFLVKSYQVHKNRVTISGTI